MRVLTFTVLVTHFYIVQACEKYSFLRHDDVEFQDHVITTMTTPYVEICWDKCVWIMNCFSINARKNSVGTIDCDLNNSSKTASPRSLVAKQGSQYYRMRRIKTGCKKNECKIKRVLGDKGYLLQKNSVVKIIIENKTWIDARTHCQSLGGDLMSISTSYENRFASEVLLKKIDLPKRIRHQTEYVFPSLSKYWPLDGHDADVSLKEDPGAAIYEAIDGEKALYLSGLRSYAEVPAFTFNPEGFTFMLWVKPISGNDVFSKTIFSNGIFSVSSSPQQTIDFRMKRIDDVDVSIVSESCIIMNLWNHIAVSWNVTEVMGRIVMNGRDEVQQAGIPGQSPQIKTSTSTHFQLGIMDYSYNQISKNTFHGHMKHLMVFNKALNKQEIQEAMYWPEQGPWIGLNAINQTSMFNWSDESKTKFMALPPGPPVQGQDCVAFKNNGQWFARNCQETRPFICDTPTKEL